MRRLAAWLQQVILASYLTIPSQETSSRVSVSLKMSPAPTWVTLAARDSNTANIHKAMVDDLKTGSFTDVVISCRDRQTVKAHKLVLVAASRFLANVLCNIDNNESAVLILPDFETTIIKRLVSALYDDGVDPLAGDWSVEEAWKTLGLSGRSDPGNQVLCNIILTLTKI